MNAAPKGRADIRYHRDVPTAATVARTLAEALPYLRAYHGKTIVVRFGGLTHVWSERWPPRREILPAAAHPPARTSRAIALCGSWPRFDRLA